eukprot:SAG11_NODE_6015_length_1409_cov_2.209160_1_plen_87_part_00
MIRGMPKYQNIPGIPPLTLATLNDDAAVVAALLEEGAPPDERDTRGCTALMYACYDRANVEIASLLCAAGAVRLQNVSSVCCTIVF